MRTWFCLLTALILALAACSGQRSPRPPPPPAYLEHSVMYQGETLGLISKWYTGSVENWRRILDNNPGLDERRMRRGTVVLIPEDMLVQSDPMPSSYVQKFYTRLNEADMLKAPGVGGTEGTGNSGLGPLHQGGSDSQNIESADSSVSRPPEKALPGTGRDTQSDFDIAERVLPNDTWMKNTAQSDSGSPARDKSREDLLKELMTEEN